MGISYPHPRDCRGALPFDADSSTSWRQAIRFGSFGLSPQQDESAGEFLGRLIANEQWRNAIAMAAHTLPLRHALWWGCLCVWQQRGPQTPPGELSAIESCVQWTLEPQEDRRARCQEMSRIAGADRPAGALAQAVFLSGGSIAPPDCPEVPPPVGAAAQCTANAILMAAGRPAPALQRQAWRQALRMAWELQADPSPWSEGGPPPQTA